MPQDPERVSGREAQRLETCRRIFGAALAEFQRSGMAEADIGAIIAAAGVARGTFYFHFPTKGHVLAELERQEQARMAGQLVKFLTSPHDLKASFTEVVRLVSAIEKRLGKTLFREILAFLFSPARPDLLQETDYPVTAGRRQSCWLAT